MRVMSLLVLAAYFIASLIPDLLQMLLAMVHAKHLAPYHVRPYLQYLDGTPWPALVFGTTFGCVTGLTSEQHVRANKEDIFAYMLITTLVFIIVQYAGVFVFPVLATAHVDPYLFSKTFIALMLALISWKGLHIPLGGLGVFLTALLALAMAVTAVAGIAMPISFDAFWFTIIGTFMGCFAAFSRS